MTASNNARCDNDVAIQILPPQLANQIAAGEVVERPSSVVKELVENSLDAGASQIHIEIEQGGQKRILVRDNGKGIAKDQLELALSRHATSKIRNIDDLDRITSMGFRGEALASISSVSRLSLTSKPKSQSEAWQAQAEGMQMAVEISPAAHPDGTTIDVLDLFFNTPARRKFLRTGKTEFQHIEHIIKRIALTRPDVQFVLQHNNRVCLRYPIAKELSKRIAQVCGKGFLENCNSVDYHFENIRLHGWCSKLGHGEANRDFQYTFVNGRMMRDKLLSHALRQVFEDTLAPQTFPAYVLYLELPPHELDINVHPAKHEVRFHQARQIHDLVFKAVSLALGAQQSEQDDNRPNHDYIKPLETDRTETDSQQSLLGNTGASKRGLGGAGRYHKPNYSGHHPSQRSLQASHAFYQSVVSQNDAESKFESSSTPEEDSQSAHSKDEVSARVTDFECVYKAPYLVFLNMGDQLQVIHIKHILKALVDNQIQRSTVSQALLMPVSVKLLDVSIQDDSKKAIAFASDIGFSLQINKHKLILKKVPSEIRHLPWASMFASINWNIQSAEPEASVTNKCEQSAYLDHLTEQIALAWLESDNIGPSEVNNCLSIVPQQTLKTLLLTNAKHLCLDAWMN